MNEAIKAQLTAEAEAVEKANKAFLAEWQKKSDNEAEANRQRAIIEAIENELSQLKEEANNKLNALEMLTPEFYAEIKQKERDLLDKKGYLNLYLDGVAIKEKERLLLLNELRRNCIKAVNKFKEKAFYLLLESILNNVKDEFNSLIALNNGNLNFIDSLFWENQNRLYSGLEKKTLNEATKNKIFNKLETYFNFGNLELKDEFLLRNHYLNQFNLFEAIRPTQEVKIQQEIELLKAKQLTSI